MNETPRRQMFLTLSTSPDGSSCSVGIDMRDALTFDREQFAAVYLNSVYGAKKKEALAWADKQIAERTRVTAAGLPSEGRRHG